MSRPIYEPSLPRADAENAYGNRQLFRRPAPRDTGGISTFQATRWTDDITDINDVNTIVDWDHWLNCAPLVFEERDTIDNPDPVEGTDLVSWVRLLVPGRYTFSLRFNLDSVSDITAVRPGIQDEDDPWGYGEYSFGGPVSPYNLGGWVAWTWTALYPLMGTTDFWPDFDGGAFVPARFTISAISADPITCSAALLEISYEETDFCLPISS